MNRRPHVPLSAAQNMLIDGQQSETFVISMGTTISQIRAHNLMPGQLYVFLMRQDWQGGHVVNWGQGMLNAADLIPTPHAITVQCFVALSSTQLNAIQPATWN